MHLHEIYYSEPVREYSEEELPNFHDILTIFIFFLSKQKRRQVRRVLV